MKSYTILHSSLPYNDQRMASIFYKLISKISASSPHIWNATCDGRPHRQYPRCPVQHDTAQQADPLPYPRAREQSNAPAGCVLRREYMQSLRSRWKASHGRSYGEQNSVFSALLYKHEYKRRVSGDMLSMQERNSLISAMYALFVSTD
jgi:hypothetical protein